MDKRQQRSDSDLQAYLDLWLEQKRKEAEQATGPGQRRSSRTTGRGQATLAVIVVSGLIVMQLLAMVVVLLILVPTKREAGRQAVTEPVAVLPTATAPPISPSPPPSPDHPPATSPPEAEAPPQVVTDESPAEPTAPPPPLPPSPVRLRGAEITQGIQVFNEPEDPQCVPDQTHPNYIFCNNSIPLVAGRHTLVRVYPACDGTCPAVDTVVRLRLLKDGQEQASFTQQISPEGLQQVSHLPVPELRVSLDHSLNFEFLPPPDWMTGEITFEFEARPTDGRDTAPAALALTRQFAVRKPLRIAYLPIQYQGLRPPEPADIDYWLQRLYPISEVDYFRLPVPELIWEEELSKGELLNKLLYTYWLYAQHHSEEMWPDQLFGWLPQEFYNGGVSDPFWCPNCAGPHSSRVAFGGLRPEQDIGGPRILVHEIAHNLGAQHAWSPTYQEDTYCFKAEGADIRVDPEWPYTQTPHIQEVGIDLYSNPPVIYPPSFYDMMAYCARPWISPHTYRKLFESPFLQLDETNPLPLANFKPQVEVSESGTLLVSGVIYPNGTVSQPEIVRLGGATASAFSPALRFVPPPGDDYCLEVAGKNQTSLARHCFDAGFLDLETGQTTESSPYFFTLPEVAAADVAQVSLSQNEVALVITTPSNHPPDVRMTYPNGGENLGGHENITWEAGDVDGDPLHFDLLYSPDGGQRWVPLAVRLSRTEFNFNTHQIAASHNALIRVIASDGFHTTEDASDGTFTVASPSANSISLLGPTTVEPGQTFEVAIVANQVGEPGLYGIQFKLDFDPSLLRVDDLRLHRDLTLVVDRTIQNQTGQLSVVATRQGQVPPLTGDITLAILTLTALDGPAEADLLLSEVIAGTRNAAPLNLGQIAGFSLRITN